MACRVVVGHGISAPLPAPGASSSPDDSRGAPVPAAAAWSPQPVPVADNTSRAEHVGTPPQQQQEVAAWVAMETPAMLTVLSLDEACQQPLVFQNVLSKG